MLKKRTLAILPYFVVILPLMIIAVSGCSPVVTPVPTPDIAATVEAAVAAALAAQPTPDIAATVEAAVATEMAATQTAQAEQAATSTPVPPTAMATPNTPTSTLTSTPTATPTPTGNTPAPPHTPTPTLALVALLTYHNRYVTAMDDQPGWDWELRAETATLRAWEKFTLLCLNDGKVALKTHHGRYVTAMDAARDWVLRAETQSLSDWERFTLVEADTGKQKPCSEVFEQLLEWGEVRVAFQTYHKKGQNNRFVTAMDDQPGWDWVLRAETQSLSYWERFTVVLLPPAVTGRVCQPREGWDENTVFLRQDEFDALGLPIGTRVTVTVRDTGRSVGDVTLSLDSSLEICSVRLAKALREVLGVDIDTAIQPEVDRPDRQFDINPTSPPTNREEIAIQGRVCKIKADQDTKTIFLRQAEFDAFGVPAGTTVSVTVLDTGKTVEKSTLGLDSGIAICTVRIPQSYREALGVAGDTDIGPPENRPDRQISIRLPQP